MNKLLKFTALVLILHGSLCLAEEESGTLYSPTGKRDPFRPPSASASREVAALSPLERFAIDQFQLKAVLKKVGKSQAMFEDPDGKTHILAEGDTIGRERGTVSRILDTEVIVTERTFNYLGVESLTEKFLSLSTEESEPITRDTGTNNPATMGGVLPPGTQPKDP